MKPWARQSNGLSPIGARLVSFGTRSISILVGPNEAPFWQYDIDQRLVAPGLSHNYRMVGSDIASHRDSPNGLGESYHGHNQGDKSGKYLIEKAPPNDTPQVSWQAAVIYCRLNLRN